MEDMDGMESMEALEGMGRMVPSILRNLTPLEWRVQMAKFKSAVLAELVEQRAKIEEAIRRELERLEDYDDVVAYEELEEQQEQIDLAVSRTKPTESDLRGWEALAREQEEEMQAEEASEEDVEEQESWELEREPAEEVDWDVEAEFEDLVDRAE